LFRHRGTAPVPLLALQLAVAPAVPALWAGAWVPVLAGLGLRAWGVGHLGARSRTRGASDWSLVDSGPFSRMRNPLYLGNGLIWLGVGLASSPAWAVGWALFLAVHYTLVVAWEEAHLVEVLGAPYVDYLSRVPRWLPGGTGRPGGAWALGEVVRGERSTWLAAALVMGALWIRGMGLGVS